MPWCSVLEKLTAPQLVKKFSTFYWNLTVHYLIHKSLTLVERFTPKKYMHSVKKGELLTVKEGGTGVHKPQVLSHHDV
jgi:hypothetical protein